MDTRYFINSDKCFYDINSCIEYAKKVISESKNKNCWLDINRGTINDRYEIYYDNKTQKYYFQYYKMEYFDYECHDNYEYEMTDIIYTVDEFLAQI
jgi:hypothetical protein